MTKMINNISYTFYNENNEYGRWICVDIMNHKTSRVMGYKISTHELDILGVSEEGFQSIMRNCICLIDALLSEDDVHELSD